MRTSHVVNIALVIVGFSVQVFARPMDIRSPNLEPARNGKPRPPIVVPVSATNLLSLGCGVTSSAVPLLGELSYVTDGSKEHDDPYVELPGGSQWVQIDLGQTQEVWAVCIWHWYEYACVYHDVICQISNDRDFIDGVATVFNNDHDNSSRLGAGADKEYIETNEGRTFAIKDVKGRYLRFYSRENTEKATSRYTEIEVFGRRPVQSQPADEPLVPLKVELPKPIFM